MVFLDEYHRTVANDDFLVKRIVQNFGDFFRQLFEKYVSQLIDLENDFASLHDISKSLEETVRKNFMSLSQLINTKLLGLKPIKLKIHFQQIEMIAIFVGL